MAANDDPRGPGPAQAGAPAPGSPVAPAQASAPPAEAGPPPAGGTRTAHTWVALSAGMVFLVVVLVFILQNLESTRVHFFWATWTIPLAVDLLLATLLGGLIMFAVGSLRIVQLRRAARRARHH